MRYENDPVRGTDISLATAGAVNQIRAAMRSGIIGYTEYVLKENQRIDHLAGDVFNDGRKWWILAAMSNIGWSMQLPAGTIIKIPVYPAQITGLIT